jgi:hypothetical protein
MFVSADEMGSWHDKGWLSFDPKTLTEYCQKERVEVLFIKGLTRSGLSDALISRTLSSLEKPYCYDPSTTFFSFVDDIWISLPPEPDAKDMTSKYLAELVESQDWDALRKLQSEVGEALEAAREH